MKQIVLERWVSSRDARGNNVETCDLRIKKWATVRRTGGGRSSLNGEITLDNVVVFETSFRSSFLLSGNWKVVYLDKRYPIQSIERKDEERFVWVLTGRAR